MDSAKNKSTTIIGNCLQCKGLVRIPTTANAKSTVRCPHCETSFSLHEIVEEVIPELELVPESPPKTETVIPVVDRVSKRPEQVGQAKEKFVVPAQLQKGAIRRRRRHRSAESDETAEDAELKLAPESSRGSDYVVRTSVEDRERPRRHHRSESSSESSRRRRGRRKSRSKPARSSPAIEMAKIVIGGLLAFPIAYLIVLWFFAQDPLSIGPAIGRAVPFAVPAEFRNADEIEKNGSPEDPGSQRAKSNDDDSLPVPDVDPDRIPGRNVD